MSETGPGPEERLAEPEQFRALFNALPVPAVMFEGDSVESAVVTRLNDAARSRRLAVRVGARLTEVASSFGIYAPNRRDRIPLDRWPVTCALVSGKAVRDREFHVQFADGEWRVFLAGAASLRQGDRVTGAILTLQDITERKRAEAAIARSEALYRTLVETSPDGIVVTDGRLGVVMVNDQTVRMCRWDSPADVVGRCALDLVAPEDHEKARKAAELLRRRGELRNLELTLIRSDCSRFAAEISASVIGDSGSHRAGLLAVMRDISGRKRAEAERDRLLESARQATAEAEEANRAKDQFVAMVSHELRNPLNAISASLYILNRRMPPDEQLQRSLEVLDRNVRLQTRLVNDLLDMSRIARGKLPLQRAPIRLNEVVRAATQSHASEAHERGLSLSVEVHPDLWVQGDQDRLQQVVSNLVSNALKFTPPPGNVCVAARRCATVDEAEAPAQAAALACISVEDTGIGISPELLPQLFDMFRQGEVAGSRSAGLGLGLALVKSLTEMHGGRVRAESAGPGRGSRFTVELPLISGPVSIEPGPEETVPAPLRVLIVEDNPDTRVVIADGLTLAGYDVRTAGSGEDGLALLKSNHWVPDIMLVDLGLPGIDGNEFLRRSRNVEGMADVPAFAVTGYGQEDDVRRSREAGFAGHFVKPVDLSALEARAREWTRPRHPPGA